MLNLLSQRRDRVVEWLLDNRARGDPHGRLAHRRTRARLALLAMIGCTVASVLVSPLVCVSFLSQLHGWRAGALVTALMLGAMLSLAAGLRCFLCEASLARTGTPPP
jgi:predicted MFS family arabinose efflux permease